LHDIASRLIAAFAQQVEARLGGADPAVAPATELKAGRLFLSVVTNRIKARLRRVFGHDR
jgi:hypothetical protein